MARASRVCQHPWRRGPLLFWVVRVCMMDDGREDEISILRHLLGIIDVCRFLSAEGMGAYNMMPSAKGTQCVLPVILE
ncbi:hypothetical protein CDAR_542651 [Caerostris darwini]|uniref:Uncharacterized protein n=1 Tax=Caerostris darwini TaxID=1538125 RepID=A0AAV4VHR6_9ARAC|nr:hypothetical protein CDAR_542651 [Caerostris darwini]